MKNILASSLMALGLTASFGTTVVSAQQTPAPEGDPSAAGDNQRMERRGRRERLGGGRDLGLLSKLNLTEPQQQQLRALQAEHAQATQTQRDELRQLGQIRMQGGQLSAEQETRAGELRQQLNDSTKALLGRASAVLTPEQRAEFEGMMKERRSRREGGRGRRMPPTAPDSQ